jgi:hypothetical protein
LRNRVEAALHRLTAGLHREALEHTIETDGLIKTFNALLSIARLGQGGRRQQESLDVAALVRDVTELYEPVAEERGSYSAEPVRPCSCAPIDNCSARCCQSRDNAIKYGAPERAQGGNGSRPEVSVTTEAKDPWRKSSSPIEDPACRVPTASACSAASSGSRQAGRSGSGLGLSLVSAVARLHGGGLRLEDNQPGLKVVLSLPADTHALVNGAAHQASGQELRPA